MRRDYYFTTQVSELNLIMEGSKSSQVIINKNRSTASVSDLKKARVKLESHEITVSETKTAAVTSTPKLYFKLSRSRDVYNKKRPRPLRQTKGKNDAEYGTYLIKISKAKLISKSRPPKNSKADKSPSSSINKTKQSRQKGCPNPQLRPRRRG